MTSRTAILATLVFLGGCDATTTTAEAGDVALATEFPDADKGNWERIALYIGINEYKDPKIPDLSGCVNDALRMRKALRSHGFLRDAILTNEQATHANVVQYLKYLVEQVKTAKNEKQVKEPLVAIYFAGHGNLVQGGDVDDGESDNTLTTHDTDRVGSKDIRDDDIHRLLTHLQSKEVGATVVFFADACHSATSFRSAPEMPVRSLARGNTDFHLRKGPTKAVFPWDWNEDPRRAYYGACDDSDVAGETEVNGVRCGKFTQVLVEILESGRPIESYEDLGFAIQQQFALTFPGARQRPTFHITNEMKDRRFLMKEQALRHARVEQQPGSAKVIINAGSIHGVEKGSRITFYKDLTVLRDIGPAGAIVSGTVLSADPGTASVRLDKEIQLANGTVARVEQPRVPAFRLRLDAGVPEAERKRIEAIAATGRVSLAKEGQDYTYAVVYDAERKCLSLYAPDQLPTPEVPTDPYLRIFHNDPEVDLEKVLVWCGQQNRLLQVESNSDLLAVDLVKLGSETPLKPDPATGFVTLEPNGGLGLRIRNLSPKSTFHIGVIYAEQERAAKGEKPGEGRRRIDGGLAYPQSGVEKGLPPGEETILDLDGFSSAWEPRPSRMRLKILATDYRYDFKRMADIAKAPNLGAPSASRGDGDEDEVMGFLENVSDGKRGITPKRTWATATVVIDVNGE